MVKTTTMPVATLFKLVDPHIFIEHQDGVGSVGSLMRSFRGNGYLIERETDPILVTISKLTGRMILKEGHHRVYAAREVGLRRLPVMLENV